jgi:antitoxin VapB
MALNIKNAEADELARRLAERTGLNITDVVIRALREALRREEGRLTAPDLAAELMEIGRHCAALPDLDPRSPDEILGYDERGVWL